MIEIDNKAISPVAVYFPKNSSTVADSYDLVLHSEVTQLDFTFSGLTNESNTNNYYKLKIDVSQIDDGVYNYQILANEEIVASGLMKVGKVEDDIPEKHSYNPFDDNNNNENEIVQYYPVGNYKHRYQNDKYVEVTEITDNLHIEVTADEGYDALYKVIVCGNTQAMYDSGVTDGIAEQKAKLIPTAVTENGVYEREDGFNSVTVDVPVDDYWNSGYTSGYTDGYESGTTDGFASGYTSGYTDGYSSGSTDGFESGYTSGYTDGYSSGYTVGFESGETYGIEEQKAKLIATAVTENGTYQREDGFNEIDVNVPVDDYWNSGYTSGYTDGYESGTTDGFASGYTSGYTDGYTSGYTDGFTSGFTTGYTSGYTDGFNTGYTSGCTDGYQEGYGDGFTSGETYGIAEQKSKLIATSITENGVFEREDGFNNVTVDIPVEDYFESGYTSGYTSGFESGETYGVAEQKAKLVATAITHNGTYEREDGFNSIVVEVESGGTINNQTKSISITENGSSAVTYDAGYTGLESVNVNVNIDVQSYWNSGYTSGYTSGYENGETIGIQHGFTSGYTSGVTDGIAEQKAKLISTAVTTNGTYSRQDGYNEIVVNVPSGSSINNQTKSITATTNGSSAITYDAGYTGLERVNVNVNVPDRWNEGYTSGKTDGVAEQKAKLIPTAVTENGTYTREDGFNSITVNVSGETIQYCKLTVNITSPVPSGLTNNVQVTVSYLTSAQTKTYTGDSIEFEDILPGVNYTVSFSQVSGYITPGNINGISTWGGRLTVSANYQPTILNNYLKFVIKTNGDIKWNGGHVIQYSKDNGSTWTSITSSTATTIPVISGDTVMFKGTNESYSLGKGFSGTTCQFDVEGNIMSLLYGDNFSGQTTLVKMNTFDNLFSNCTGLTSAQNLELPATTLAGYCYQAMFSGCTSLTSAPELPATTLAGYCYSQMFAGCTSLTSAPVLPATTLANQCYNMMFQYCSALVNAPVLSATTLAEGCYQYMFNRCTSLTTAPSLPATNLATNCYGSMFAGCSSLVTAPVLSATTLASGCYNYMFANCSALVNAPALPAETLADSCYFWMFMNCSSLTTAPELPAKTLTYRCYYSMFSYCTSLNYIKCLATDISASQCVYHWTEGVPSSGGTFVKDASMTDWTTGVNGIPTNWTVQDA